MKTFYLDNENLSFLEAVVLKDVASIPTNIRMLTSRNLIAHEWNDAAFTVTQAEPDICIRFDRPINDLHIRIDLAGELPEPVVLALLPYRGMNAPETTAHLRSMRIIFLGCARDCESRIDDAIAVLSKFGKYFNDCKIAVFENDSKDSTYQKLSLLAQRGELTLLHDSGLDRQFPQRTARLAYARNQLLQWAQAQGAADHICFADLDGIVNSSMNADGFLSNFSLAAVWDGVFPVNDDFYYDVYTMRQKDISNDNYAEAMGRVDASIGKRLARWLAGHSKLLDLRAMDGWLPVDSAFGGMSIYKYQAIISRRFIGLDADNNEVGEHVSVNLNIVRNGGRLFINPLFVIAPAFGP